MVSAFLDEVAAWAGTVETPADELSDVVLELDGRRVLVIAHSAQRWALRHLLEGVPLEDLVDAPFEWQEGWEDVVPASGRRAGG